MAGTSSTSIHLECASTTIRNILPRNGPDSQGGYETMVGLAIPKGALVQQLELSDSPGTQNTDKPWPLSRH